MLNFSFLRLRVMMGHLTTQENVREYYDRSNLGVPIQDKPLNHAFVELLLLTLILRFEIYRFFRI